MTFRIDISSETVDNRKYSNNFSKVLKGKKLSLPNLAFMQE